MTQHVMPSSHRHPHDHGLSRAHLTSLSAYLVPLGRLLFTLIFLQAIPTHFSSEGIAHAAHSGTPWPSVLVPFAGILLILGGLSVLLGYHARLGALLLALFLIPVTLVMHQFWNIPDANMARMQMVMFMKNVSLLGATLLILHFGSGPFSVDSARARRP